MVAPIYRFLLLLHLHPSLAKTIRCTNTTSLHAALVSVEPGDEILLAPGTYYDEDGISGTASHFPAQIDGLPNARIILRGEDPNNKPLLSGSDAGSRTVLGIIGLYKIWQLLMDKRVLYLIMQTLV